MAKGTKISIKAKGTAAGVKKALNQILSKEDIPAPALREADFVRRNKNAQR